MTTPATLYNIDTLTPFTSASSIAGIPISNTPPLNGQTLEYVAGSNVLQFVSPGTSLASPWTRVPDATTADEQIVYNPVFPTAATDNLVAGPQTTEAAGTQLFFINNAAGGQGSFRAGSVTGTQWIAANRGVDSFAAGLNNTASGPECAVVGGSSNVASGVTGSAFIGAGTSNICSGNNAFIGAGSSNVATSVNGAVCGGLSNTASGADSFVGCGISNSAVGAQSVVCGGGSNVAPLTGNTANAIASGILCGLTNTIAVAGAESVIVGGISNTVNAGTAAIVGGTNNIVAGTGTSAFIGGGTFNTASGALAVVVGGGGTTTVLANQATGSAAFVGAGTVNLASGTNAVVAGGNNNTAGGNSAWAGGNFASASHNNSFVWGDGTSTALNPTADAATNQFVVSCAGGSNFYTTARPGVVGPSLVAASIDWVASSAREIKENIIEADHEDILRRVVDLPVYMYNIIGTAAADKSIGPIAQEWNERFETRKHAHGISNADMRGVSLCAIKALAARNAALAKSNGALAARLDALELKHAQADGETTKRSLQAAPKRSSPEDQSSRGWSDAATARLKPVDDDPIRSLEHSHSSGDSDDTKRSPPDLRRTPHPRC
jgi:hypothetical protein